MDDYRNSPTIKFCADLFPAHRCPSAIKFQITLECASVSRSNVLLISKAYFPVVSLAAVFSIVTQLSWGGALRDDTKNGCEGDDVVLG